MKEIMDQEKIARTLRRMSHEIIETNDDLENLIFVGIKSKGFPIAKRLSDNINTFENIKIVIYGLNISMYRDDMKIKESVKAIEEEVDFNNKTIVIVDDVLQSGRTVRAAMDAIMDLGRAKEIKLAIMIDRGHRELPIRPDYVGKNLPTSHKEKVVVNIDNDLSNDKIIII